MEDLNQVPQTIEEMGEVNEKYQKIMAEKPKVKNNTTLHYCICFMGQTNNYF